MTRLGKGTSNPFGCAVGTPQGLKGTGRQWVLVNQVPALIIRPDYIVRILSDLIWDSWNYFILRIKVLQQFFLYKSKTEKYKYVPLKAMPEEATTQV